MGQGSYGTCYILRVHVNISSNSLFHTFTSMVKNDKKEKYILVTFVYFKLKTQSKRINLNITRIERVVKVRVFSPYLKRVG